MGTTDVGSIVGNGRSLPPAPIELGTYVDALATRTHCPVLAAIVLTFIGRLESARYSNHFDSDVTHLTCPSNLSLDTGKAARLATVVAKAMCASLDNSIVAGSVDSRVCGSMLSPN